MRSITRSVWLILALALLLRIGATAILTDELPPGADESAYRTIAASIASGDGYPDRSEIAGGGPSAASPPGYPYLLGGLFALSGDSVDFARAAQALLGTLTVALIGLVAWQVFGRREVALAALAIAAVYPPLVVISAPLMTESLLLPALLGMVAAALELRRSGALRWAAVAGALGGVAVLTKDVGMIALLVITVAIWARPRLRLESLRAPALAVGVALLVVAPWEVRNASEFGSFVPVSTKLGLGLAGSYNETVRADPEHVWAPPYQLPELRDVLYGTELDEAEVSRELQSRAIDFVGDHPTYPLALAYRNTRRMLQLQTSGLRAADAELLGFSGDSRASAAFKAAYWSSAVGFALLVILTIAAVVRGYARRVPAFIYMLAALQILSLVFIAGGPRYRLPADALLLIVAAPAVAELVSRFVPRRTAAQPAG